VPAGSISSPVTPRTKSPGCSRFGAPPPSAWFQLCLAERLITFRLEHPIAACMELAARLKDLFHLVYCEVVPTDPAAPLSAAGIAERPRTSWNRRLRTEKPTIVALGTGRAVRAAVRTCLPDRLSQSPDRVAGRKHLGRRLGELLRYRRASRRSHQGAPLSDAVAISDVVGGRTHADAQVDPIAKVRAVAARADLRLVGIGQMDQRRKCTLMASSRVRSCSK